MIKKYAKAYKIFEKNDNINLIDPQYLILLHEYDFEHYLNIPQPKYKHLTIVFIILDDLIGENKVFKQQSLINNITIKHRHLGINLVFTSQNPRSIPNIIRNNRNLTQFFPFFPDLCFSRFQKWEKFNNFFPILRSNFPMWPMAKNCLGGTA